MFGFVNDLEKGGRCFNHNGVTDLKKPKIVGQVGLRTFANFFVKRVWVY